MLTGSATPIPKKKYDLLTLVPDLGDVEALLSLAGEVRAAAHGDRAGNRFGQSRDVCLIGVTVIMYAR